MFPEEGGEGNISTGWHAIEFLLWGQDLNEDGPGCRPVSAYTTADNADRRATYLAVSSDQLLSHLQDMVNAWAPNQGNYRAQFVSKDSDDAITDIITGIGEMSRGELAGERMTVAYDALTHLHRFSGVAFVLWLVATGFMLFSGRVERLFIARFGGAAPGGQ